MAAPFLPHSPPEFGWGGQHDGFGLGEQPSPSFLPLALDTSQGGPGSTGQGQFESQVSGPHDNAASAVQVLDVDMSGANAQVQGTLGEHDHSSDPNASGEQPAHSRRSGRSKYRDLDWDAYKATMKALYIVRDMNLSETMRVMEQDYSFKASQKVYKEQFDLWGWKKKLPTKIAQFMREKAERRKREVRRDTVFTYGGKKWTRARAERTLARAKVGKNTAEMADAHTPEGVTYKTPSSAITSPSQGDVNHDPVNEDSEGGVDSVAGASVESDNDSDVAGIPLSFKGMSRTDLLAMWEVARTRSGEIPQDQREQMLNRVFDGLAHLQGATNEGTSKVAYALADFYVKTGRSDEADKVLERQTQVHIKVLGYEHKKTRQHVLHVVELLNGWNRPEDALGMLSRTREMLDMSDSKQGADSAPSAGSSSATRREQGGGRAVGRGIRDPSVVDLSGVANLVSSDPTRARIDYAISMARPAVRASDAAAEAILLSVLHQCRLRPQQLAPQLLRATADLLALYQRLGVQDAHRNEFQQAQAAVSSALDTYIWDLESFEGFELVEAALEAVARLVRCGYKREGKTLFRRIQADAELVFGASDERTIWTLISIGLVYQTHCTWGEAEEWFEAAFAAALSTTWDRKDGIIQSLQKAMDRRHFSYVSDEGRPFKTVFGVGGMTIRPLRLHIE